MAVYAGYTLEPCWLRPWELARLTDFQLVKLYREPMAEMAREIEKAKRQGGRSGSGGMPSGMDGGDDGIAPYPPSNREEFVGWWAKVNGGGREAALAKHAEIYPGGS